MLTALSTASAEAARNLDDGEALQGFDPVSYFDGVPRMGRKHIVVEHDGAVYRFSNEANRNRFLADPERFEPAFGGFCAWGVVDDADEEDVVPSSWKIVDGRLLLFYKGYLGDGLRDWEEESVRVGGESVLLERADIAWSRLRNE